MDYCFPPDVTSEINLNLPNGADAQCAHNRSGLLCGSCSLGLSLSLGSSHCLPCLTYWSGVLVAIIFSTLFAGILLVASLLMLNVTVAVGTLNGLILYANIVAINQDKFFPSSSFITVFLSWFNLEFGIDTCFFEGMDFYRLYSSHLDSSKATAAYHCIPQCVQKSIFSLSKVTGFV